MLFLIATVVLGAVSLGLLVWAVYYTVQYTRLLPNPTHQTASGYPVCPRGATYPSCVIPIGYDVDPSGGIVSNSFGGGVSLPTQLLGSTFDGAMYDWDSQLRQVDGDAKFSIARLEGLANGITAITWGADRDDGLGLANRTTVEHCTGYGVIRKTSDPDDLSCGWETGVIYAGERSETDTTKFTLMPFIHIYKIDTEGGKPTKLRMWEALVDDELKSMLYTEQLKNNIGAETLFGDGETFSSLTTGDLYSGSEKYQPQYMEMSFDLSRGVDVPPMSSWSKDQSVYARLADQYAVPM